MVWFRIGILKLAGLGGGLEGGLCTLCQVDKPAIRVCKMVRDAEMEGTVLVSSRKLFVALRLQD